MDDTVRTQLLDRIAKTVGDDAFNRLVGSLKEVRQFRRLRFWQEDLLGQAGVSISTCTEFLDLFDGVDRRATGRSKDALAAATTSFWAPILREHEFERYTTRSFGRVKNECVFQYIDLQLSSFGGKDFAVNYCSILITRLHHAVGSTTFRRLPRGKSHDGWWSAKTLMRADESMQDVCDKTKKIALPWFDSTSSAMGLAQELVQLAEHANPHAFFELGCCHATAGNLAEAIGPLREAIRLFQKSYDEMPERTWARSERSLAESLVAAIADGTHESLLSRWRDQSVVNLKLDKIGG
jgi:Domain of unknown function (DUF4304)